MSSGGHGGDAVVGFKVFEDTVAKAIHSEGAHLAAQEMTTLREHFEEGAQDGRFVLHELKKRLAVDVPHDAVGHGIDFDGNDVGRGKKERWSQQHRGFQMVHQHLAAFLARHPCLGLTLNKNHQCSTRVARVEHSSSCGVFLSATRLAQQAFQSLIAATCKEFDSFEFFHGREIFAKILKKNAVVTIVTLYPNGRVYFCTIKPMKGDTTMSYNDWKDKTASFKKIDVRGVQGNFFPGIKMQAMKMAVGEGMEIVQNFDPLPLYEVMDGLGFERHTEKVTETEYHAYFYRTEVKQLEKDIPMRPAPLTHMPMIDEKLGNIAVNFWDLTWNDEHRYLPYEMRLLLSLTNAVGAGRMRQATRELVKAYIHGLDSAALDDVFELLAWNQGIGYFSSEIGPSALFQAYKTIKQMEKKGNTREEIAEVLKEKFGEKHPDVKVV